MEIADLPHLIATLNGMTLVFLIAGYRFIRRGERSAHKKCMLTALGLAAGFLAVYLFYHFNSGFARFGGEGIIRPVYFTILIVHILGAMALVPLVPMTVFMAWKGTFPRHRRLARWTWPLWVYVSVSGVVVYVMAIHLYPYG